MKNSPLFFVFFFLFSFCFSRFDWKFEKRMMVISLSNYRFFFVFDGWFFFFYIRPSFRFFISQSENGVDGDSKRISSWDHVIRSVFILEFGFYWFRVWPEALGWNCGTKKKIDSARFCFTLSLGDAVRREWFAKKNGFLANGLQKRWIFGQWESMIRMIGIF